MDPEVTRLSVALEALLRGYDELILSDVREDSRRDYASVGVLTLRLACHLLGCHVLESRWSRNPVLRWRTVREV
jgi:hypothetical protein